METTPLSEQMLRERTWQFLRADGTVLARGVRFGENGKIVGHISNNEVGWRIHDGRLELVGHLGAPTTRFDAINRQEDGKLELRGPFLLKSSDQVLHVLREVSLAPKTAVPPPTRRNLVVMRAGNKALLPDWTPAPTRNWDIAISFYGDGRPDWGQEFFVARKGPKWTPIYQLFADNPDLLRQYDWFWFPDDDIMTTWENVNTFFRICHDFDLQLTQPALTGDSFILHEVTRERAEYLLRFTIWVECMVPAFRADALRLCLPVMQEKTKWGWGHDWVYPKLLGYPDNKIAIIDACAVTHTRPPGANTEMSVARDEFYAVLSKYGARFMDHRIRGAIFREPAPVHP